MNLDELVKMPEPWHNVTHHKVDVFTRSQLRDYGQQVAAAVAKRCAEICEREMVAADETGMAEDYAYNNACKHGAAAIRREFGEVSNG